MTTTFDHQPNHAPVIDPTMTVGIKAMTTAALAWLGPNSSNGS